MNKTIMFFIMLYSNSLFVSLHAYVPSSSQRITVSDHEKKPRHLKTSTQQPKLSAKKFQKLNDILYNIDPNLKRFNHDGYDYLLGFAFSATRSEKHAAEPINLGKLISYLEIFGPHGNPNPFSQGFVEQLVQRYKIHLMPATSDQLHTIITTIFDKKNLFGTCIYSLKIKDDSMSIYQKTHDTKKSKDYIEQQLKDAQGKVFPIIVIYPGGTKNDAQQCLNLLCRHFGAMKGLGITPRYNKKVTSLMYYAQGDSDDKKNQHYMKYYTDLQQDNRAHYKVKQFKKGLIPYNITLHLDQQDMELIIPKKCSRKHAFLTKTPNTKQ